jgi:hypothetical protein
MTTAWTAAWLTKRELIDLLATRRMRRIDRLDAIRVQRYLRGDRSAASFDRLDAWTAQIVTEVEVVEREANATK